MSMPGGAANKVGNRYERRWTVLKLFDVLAGDANSIEIEALGEEDSGAEFLLMRGEIREWHQVKLQHKDGDWTIARLNEKSVLARWWPKLQAGDRCEFVSGSTARQLDVLVRRAREAGSWPRFNAILGNGNHRRNYDKVREAWGNPPDEDAFLALLQIRVTGIDEEQLQARLLDRAALTLDGDPAVVVRYLLTIVDDALHQRMTARDIEQILAAAEGLRIHLKTSREQGRQPSIAAPADNPASANLQVSGHNNNVSLNIGRSTADRPSQDAVDSAPSSNGRRRMVWYALVALVVVVAGAALIADRAWNPSGVPEYFQTGPTAGIHSYCENGPALDGLVSTQENVFTDVSRWSQLSLDGRSAFVMKGMLNGTTYYWVISDFNGYGMPSSKGTPGAEQIIWWVSGGKHPACNISFLSSPPAVLAQEGIRQVSTMAVPSSIYGKQTYIKACIWYKPQKNPKSECWPRS